MPYFRFPFICPPNYYNNFKNTQNSSSSNSPNDTENKKNIKNEKNTSQSNEKYFFELFGLKLYFDDILLICLLIFLYQEGNKDDELFLSLILLLLS